MSTGQRIKSLRKKRGFSQVDLALEVGVSKQTMYKYENDIVTNIPSDKIEAIAEILFTTPSYLMGWTDDPNDWERIGNEKGIYPPKDYEGDYEDYVKFKINEQKEYFDKNFSDYLRADEKELLDKYNALNQNGQKEAQKRVTELSMLPDYTLNKKISNLSDSTILTSTALNAAHTRTDIETPENTDTSDNDIMDDPDF